ncbi:8771_t:CDS:2 [Scutellospora calospora]|uniref:8771_t:CDS:1 n=1 Tax=Scutellospora calospora TaxID=85575 RepID=A0ACA9JZB2_9GLOM|nr:8771_t:CDS:2 [Scutellospora calospora]
MEVSEPNIEGRKSPLKRTRSPVSRIKDSINYYLFPNSGKDSTQLVELTVSEQESKIDQLRTYLEELGHPLETLQLENLLVRNSWNVMEVADYCKDLVEAEEGLVLDIQKDVIMLGSENDRFTSCYIDSLMFAMFARTRAFDGMLFIQQEGRNVRSLQTHLRLFVNRLRTGKHINAHMVKQLRESMFDCGWIGKDESENPTQEDASELFLFLSCLYELPYLPLEIHLFHGGSKDPNDERVITERLIQVAIPGDPHDETPVSLEEVLVTHFHDSVVSGIKRFSVDDSEQTEIPVSAWQVLKLLPFYSASNEQGEKTNAVESHFPANNLILPLVLKRYGYNDQMQSFRIKKKIYIPASINFNPFISPDAADDQCHCGVDTQYRLKLRSVVCHYGETPTSGHYKGYALDDEQGQWYRLDDLDVKEFNTLQDMTLLFSDFSRHGYLLFYELQRFHPGIVEEELAIEHDYYVAQNLQLVEFLDEINVKSFMNKPRKALILIIPFLLLCDYLLINYAVVLKELFIKAALSIPTFFRFFFLYSPSAELFLCFRFFSES